MMRMIAPILAAAEGALAFVITQLCLVPASSRGVRWFLDSRRGINTTIGVFALAAFLIHVLDRTPSPWRPLWQAAGVSVAFVGYLMVIGPGNLFPLVVVMGLTMLLPVVVAAGYIGMALGGFLRKGEIRGPRR